METGDYGRDPGDPGDHAKLFHTGPIDAYAESDVHVISTWSDTPDRNRLALDRATE